VLQPYVVGLHLGPVLAPSAIVLIRRTAGATQRDPVTHCVAAAARWPARTRYDLIMPLVSLVLDRASRREQVAALVANITGVPKTAVDLADQVARPVRFEPTRVTTAECAAEDAEGWRVPERDLVGVLHGLLAQERLKVPGTLPLAPALLAQIDAFGTASHPGDRYNSTAARDDDLVMALALACWFGEFVSPAQIEEDPSEFDAWSPEALRYEYEKRRIKGTPPKRSGPSVDGIC
jgi:hypothetical protein